MTAIEARRLVTLREKDKLGLEHMKGFLGWLANFYFLTWGVYKEVHLIKLSNNNSNIITIHLFYVAF